MSAPDTLVAVLVLPEPPSANRYWRSVVIGGRVRVLLSAEARAYRTAAQRAIDAGTPHTGPVAVSLTWYRARKSGDLDNRIKQVLDALKGLVYTDDDQVTRIAAERKDDPRYKGTGRVEVIVTSIE